MVAETTNAHLEAAGLTVTIDHRSLAEQARAAADRGDELQAMALSREPTKHLGKAAAALSRKGMDSRLVAENDAIEAGNTEHLDYLTLQAGREGRAVPMSASVGHAQGGRPASMQGLAPGLEIRGVSGMRLPQVLGRQHEATEGPRPISLAERVAQALRDLQDIARARADLRPSASAQGLNGPKLSWHGLERQSRYGSGSPRRFSRSGHCEPLSSGALYDWCRWAGPNAYITWLSTSGSGSTLTTPGNQWLFKAGMDAATGTPLVGP